jgi:hypothetical protein
MTARKRAALPAQIEPQAQDLTPMAMIGQAIAKGASIETLERLMTLQERWEAGEARREFDVAMAAARAEIKPVLKKRHVNYPSSRGGPPTDYFYEDLAAVADEVDPIFAKHGLSYRFRSEQSGTAVTVTCIMSHRRGHREETSLSAGYDNSGSKNPVQAIGSTVTYLQRYTLKLGAGLAAARDDDGRSASNGDANAVSTRIDEVQYRTIKDLIEKADTTEELLLGYLKAGSLESINQGQFKQAEAALRQKITANAKRAEQQGKRDEHNQPSAH